MFIGEYQHSLDQKGRIAVPAKFRGELGDSVVINRYLDGCLAVYTQQAWNKQYDNLMALNQNHADNRKYVRAMTSKASESTFDAQGRISIPTVLIELGKLTKDCVFIGAGDHIELWSKENWDQYNESLDDDEILKISEQIQ